MAGYSVFNPILARALLAFRNLDTHIISIGNKLDVYLNANPHMASVRFLTLSKQSYTSLRHVSAN